jgi:hypothetical protein
VSYAQSHGDFVVPLLGPLRSWQFVFLVIGLPGLAVALLIFIVREPARRGVSTTGRAALWSFLTSRGRMIIGHFGDFSLLVMLTYSVLSWSPTYLIRHFHWDVAKIGVALAIQALCTIGSAMAMAWCVDQWFQRGRTDAHLPRRCAVDGELRQERSPKPTCNPQWRRRPTRLQLCDRKNPTRAMSEIGLAPRSTANRLPVSRSPIEGLHLEGNADGRNQRDSELRSCADAAITGAQRGGAPLHVRRR